jgi:nuclear transport factor 2 (NTF2) superfamily protein
MSTATTIGPPFTLESATRKVQMAEDAWYRSYGTELWEFDPEGLMRKRLASINDAPLEREERRVF